MGLSPVTFPSLGWVVVDWIETYLVHGPGDVQGEPIVLDDEQVLLICWIYRIRPADHAEAGRRLIHRAIFSRPKGRAKSELAGMLVCAEALGPVRFDGWDANGDPVGKPVTAPFIRCLATEEDQSGNTYDNVEYMLQYGPAADEFAVDVGMTRTFLKGPSGGEIRPSTSGDTSKDGGLETFAVADETHLYNSDKLRRMYGTVARNTGKRKEAQPWMLDTTTAWLPGERSIAETAADRYSHLDVEVAIEKHGVLYDHRQGDEPAKFGDDRSLIKAMKPGYGPAVDWMDFKGIVKRIRDAEDPEPEAYRYWLNRPRAAASHWLSPDEIQAVLTDGEIEQDSRIGVGFDGSEVDDHTALWIAAEQMRVVDDAIRLDTLLQPVGIWTPADEEADWKLDVDHAVQWVFDHFEVTRFLGDPPWWQLELGMWAQRHSDPKQSGTLPVAEFWTNRDTPMAVACGALRTAIRQQRIRINPKPLYTEPQKRQNRPLAVWHFENARTRKVRVKLEDKAEEAWTVRKERPGSPLKIDSVPAAVLALEAREQGRQVEPKKKYARATW